MKWFSGGKDHFRDCENYIQAGYVILSLDEYLFDEQRLQQVRIEQKEALENRDKPETQEKKIEDDFLEGIQERWKKRGSW
jgi:hypothetical protein